MREWLDQTISPEWNTTLNGLGGVLLVIGYIAIKRRWVTLHKTCMLAALFVFAIFLASYVYYHYKAGSTEFAKHNPSAPRAVGYLYYTLLVSHVLLAIVVVPLALVTAYRGLRKRLKEHMRIARWTLPIWLYVSVTGVVVYWMLYRLYPSP
jgi:putative membrane protein